MTLPWLIFKALPTLDWVYVDVDPHIRFAQSDIAFSNDRIRFEWAVHFNSHSWGKSAMARSQ